MKHCLLMKFSSRRRFPKLHSGPSTQRVVPYQNDAPNQQPQKTRQHQGEGNQRDHGKAHDHNTIRCSQLHRPHPGLLATGKPCLHHLNENSIGATLRIDLPHQPGQELPYARTVADYLTADTNATSILFAVYSSETHGAGQARPHAGTIAALTGVLAEQGITIRDGLFVGDDTFSPYDGEPGTSLALPVSSTQTSAINAEFIYRGSFVEPTDRITLPTTRQEAAKAAAVERHMDTIRTQPTDTALQQGRKLWAGMLDSKTFPSDDDCHALVANLQFPSIRDRLIADIPGVDEPMQQILFAQTERAPKWSRIEWAQQLLLHAYTRTSANTPHQSSQPSATSTGGKAKAAKPTNSSNSPSTPTPPTASPASATK
jgi:hypothetical protein